MKIGIYTNNAKKDLVDFCAFLTRKNIQFDIIADKNAINDGYNYLIIFGGDGTVLRVATVLAEKNIPALCINCGNIGFLTEFEESEAESAVEALLNGDLQTESRLLLNVCYKDKHYNSLNELVVQRNSGNISGDLVVKLGVYIDGLLADEICGDGVIVTTPSGSTAYSLSAGGAILSPGLNAIGITPICAHSLHNRPVVCSGNSGIVIENRSKQSALLVLDGVIIGELEKDEKINIKKSELKLNYMKKPNSNFFDKLKTKLFRRG